MSDDELAYGGVCPVCGDEFIDGFGELEEMETYDGRICVIETGTDGTGKMLVHLPDVDPDA
jgi:hypothetical protein